MRTSHFFLGGWILLLVLIPLVRVEGQKQCWFNDGNLAPDDIPCTGLTTLDDADVPCCGVNSTCLENRMCHSNDTLPHLSRGSCTDWQWQSGNCPQFCKSIDGPEGIWNCTTHDGVRGSSGEPEYCCWSNNTDCCTQPAKLFTAGAWSFTSSPPPSPTSSASSATSSTASTKKTSSGTDYKSIGIGVGVGVVVTLAVIVIAALFWRRHRRRRGHQSVGSSSSADSTPQSSLPVQMSGPTACYDNTDGGAIGTRSYELESMKKPSELHGSEPGTKDLNAFTPRILRPSSIDKLD